MRIHNRPQRGVFEEIKADIDSGTGGLYFIDAPAGTGKTFLSTTLLGYTRQQEEIALATASSGIAATLLAGARTAHSRYKIPLDPTDTSTCNITRRQSDQTRTVIAKAKFLLWDEVPMTNRLCFEAFDRTLRDVLSSHPRYSDRMEAPCATDRCGSSPKDEWRLDTGDEWRDGSTPEDEWRLDTGVRPLSGGVLIT